MIKYAIIINQETKMCDVGTGTDIEYYKSIGMTEMDVEQSYDGNWYIVGYASQKPQESCEEEVRKVRNEYLEKYVDWYQSKPLLWEELNEEEKQYIREYRQYLKDYTEIEQWWEQNPLTFEEWKESN